MYMVLVTVTSEYNYGYYQRTRFVVCEV